MVKLDRIEHNVTIPEGVTATLSEDGVVTIAGPNGSLSRAFVSSRVEILQDGGGLIVRTDLPRRKDKAMAGTWNAHLNNMVKGVTEGFTYHLKAFYSHFPMTLAVQGQNFVVNNYFGEKVIDFQDINHNFLGLLKKDHIVALLFCERPNDQGQHLGGTCGHNLPLRRTLPRQRIKAVAAFADR